ncbi:hypothetical protein Tco_0698352 [Tanacetum coccineum]
MAGSEDDIPPPPPPSFHYSHYYRIKLEKSGKQEDSKALVTLDGEGVDWTSHSEDEKENYALMACSSSGSDTKMSAKDKAGLGYGDQMNKSVLSCEQ